MLLLAGFISAASAQSLAGSRATAAQGPDAGGNDEAEIPVLVLATEETTLSSQMAGKIRRIGVGLGDSVAAGAKVIEFDCSEQDAQLRAAQAEYRGARETHLTKLRLQALGAAGELEVTVAAFAADKARSQMELRNAQIEYCYVQAPFGGRVAKLRVKVAESVPAGQALVDLVNLSALKAQMFMPVSVYPRIKAGQSFVVRIRDTGRSYRATISKINSRVDGVSQQLEVEARFSGNLTGLLPGMVGVAVFSGGVRR